MKKAMKNNIFQLLFFLSLLENSIKRLEPEGNRLGHVIDDIQFNRLEETDRQEERRHAR